jgi:Trk K+ transport system NAD-binding subunit
VVTTMTTLGFGDITFKSDIGRIFSMVVMLTGVFMLLVMLPFTFIEFLYSPWMKAQSNARAPRELAPAFKDHVLIVHHGPVAESLVEILNAERVPYAIVLADHAEALRLHDRGLSVLLGEPDDPETYRRGRIDQASLVATLGTELINTNVTFTVREVSDSVPIFATARSDTAEDVLRHTENTQVLRLGRMLGLGMARRTHGGDNLAHVVGSFDELLVAEAAMHGWWEKPYAKLICVNTWASSLPACGIADIWNPPDQTRVLKITPRWCWLEIERSLIAGTKRFASTREIPIPCWSSVVVALVVPLSNI